MEDVLFRRSVVSLCLLLCCALPGGAQPHVPEWAKDAVWYQIFPERFRNGDPRNDPTVAELKFPRPKPWKMSPWTSDWYKLQPWEAAVSNRFYDVVFDRRYGGDLQGVLDELDYLKNLGITAVYFNPVFEGLSLHKYDASTYHHIDNNFGPDSQGDLQLMKGDSDAPSTWKWTAADSLFLTLLREAHARGMRVIIDGVFNHCGTDFWAFQDVVRNQQKSKYREWFDVRRWDDPSTPEDEFEYRGWWGVKGLPEFFENDSGFVSAVKEYFFNVTRRWMDPNSDGDPSDGIDGWRLDVANDVSHVFWKQWCGLVKEINPDGYIVGEIWDDASEWLTGDQFDAVMNYRFARAVVRYFIDTGSRRYDASEFDEELADVRKSYPADVNYVLQNLIDSHDTDRLGSMVANPNRKYDDANSPRYNPNYKVRKPTGAERQLQKLIALFQMTYLGAPMVYYGTEAGMWGADDPDDRKPMVWPDLQYEDERSGPIPDTMRPDDPVSFDRELFEYYARLIRIRKEHVALRRGDFATLVTDDRNDIYAFRRCSGADTVIVVLNNSAKEQSLPPSLERGTYRNEFTGADVLLTGGQVPVLEPKSGAVLTKR
jgi:cyclomaltodextrinase